MKITKTQELSKEERGLITQFVRRIAKRMVSVTERRDRIDEYIGYGYLGICVHLNTEGWDRDSKNGIQDLLDSAIYYMMKYLPHTLDKPFDGSIDEEEDEEEDEEDRDEE